MADYRKMYQKLLVAVLDALELLQRSSLGAVEIYISSDEIIIEIVDNKQVGGKEG